MVIINLLCILYKQNSVLYGSFYEQQKNQVYSHIFVYFLLAENLAIGADLIDRVSFQVLLSGTLSVDSFFVLR